jgi:hypothetical protein
MQTIAKRLQKRLLANVDPSSASWRLGNVFEAAQGAFESSAETDVSGSDKKKRRYNDRKKTKRRRHTITFTQAISKRCVADVIQFKTIAWRIKSDFKAVRFRSDCGTIGRDACEGISGANDPLVESDRNSAQSDCEATTKAVDTLNSCNVGSDFQTSIDASNQRSQNSRREQERRCTKRREEERRKATHNNGYAVISKRLRGINILIQTHCVAHPQRFKNTCVALPQRLPVENACEGIIKRLRNDPQND